MSSNHNPYWILCRVTNNYKIEGKFTDYKNINESSRARVDKILDLTRQGKFLKSFPRLALFLTELLFERTFDNTQNIYNVCLRVELLEMLMRKYHRVLSNPTLKKRWDKLLECLVVIDKILLELAISNWLSENIKVRIHQICFPDILDDLTNLVFSYICPFQGIHFYNFNAAGFNLKCVKHSKSLNYLHCHPERFDIITTGLSHEVLSSKKYWNLTHEFNLLQREYDTIKKRLATQMDSLEETEHILKKRKSELVSADMLIELKAKMVNGYSYQPLGILKAKAFNDHEINESIWFYQHCQHGFDAHKNCLDTCFERIEDQKYVTALEIGYEKCKHMQNFHFFKQRVGDHNYIIELGQEGKYCLQKNLATKKNRLLRRIISPYSVFKSIPDENFCGIHTYKKIYEYLLEAGKYDDQVKFQSDFGLYYAGVQEIRKLFLGSASNKYSMTSYMEENKLALKEFEVLGVINSSLANIFLSQQKNIKNQEFRNGFLFGFHGTGRTSPQVVCESGLDPRFSNVSNYLGQASYISENPYYCHTNNYKFTNKNNEFFLILVCFLPGRPYHEPYPNSKISTSRRMPPAGFDSVTAVVGDSSARIWALYERSVCYPFAIIKYRF